MPIRRISAMLRRDAPKLGIIASAMFAFMAWATFQMPRTAAVQWVGWGLLVLATASIGVSVITLVRRNKHRRRSGSAGATGRTAQIALLVLALVVAWVLAMLPTRGAWSWLATGGTLLCVLAALYLGLRLARTGTPALLRQAQYLHEHGQTAEALKRLDELEAERPDDPAALQLRVTILRDSKRYGPAHKAAQRLIAAHPDLYHGYAEDGLTYLAEKKPAAACEPLAQGARIAPDLAEAHLNLGLAQVDAKRRADAIPALERALSMGLRDEIDELIGLYGLYGAYRAAHRYGDATAALKRIKRKKGVLRRWRLELVDGGDASLLGEIEGLVKK